MLRRWARSLALLAPMGVAACGTGAQGGGASVSGVVGGAPFTARDSYATQGRSATSSGLPEASVTIVITDYAGACATAGAYAGGTTLVLTITRQGAAVVPGTYGADGGGGEQVSAALQRTDAQCHLGAVDTMSSGSVTLDSVSATEVAGSFQLTFPDGSLSGSFHAAPCGADAGTFVGAVDASAGLDAGAAGEGGACGTGR
jgi:hypothetical protein